MEKRICLFAQKHDEITKQFSDIVNCMNIDTDLGVPDFIIAEFLFYTLLNMKQYEDMKYQGEWNTKKIKFDMEKTMNFGGAIAALKEGKKVSRMGWNGKGMYLFAFPGMKVSMTLGCELPDELNFKHHLLKLQFNGSDDVEILPSIVMKTADNKVLVGWLASQTDMLSEDWVIVE